jgi:tRNA nucleotidyltransferase (CCA-adding enzyme)
VPTPIRAFVRSLGVDAYIVGGAVRDELLGIEHADEDFLVTGVDQADLEALLSPHGRIEELVVAGQRVGVRFHPRADELRCLAPAGIEFTPPRAERSTGPGRHDFEIVSSREITVEQDMARRDFTVNAMARRLETGEVVDPFAGRAHLADRVLHTVSDSSFVEDPLRILRGLRLVSQLDFAVSDSTLAQMREHASALRHVSAERIGGGLGADGMGELSKLLLGRAPGTALRLARDTGVLVEILPELRPTIGFELGAPRHPVALDEHLIRVVESVHLEGKLGLRLAALLHDVGKPGASAAGADHAEVSASLARRALDRLRYPIATQRTVEHLIRAHAFGIADPDEEDARRFLAAHGLEGALDLVLLRRADLEAKLADPSELAARAELESLLAGQAHAPHRLSHLAVDGADLLALGFCEGPGVGRTLGHLLDWVLGDPGRNDRDLLLVRATQELP